MKRGREAGRAGYSKRCKNKEIEGEEPGIRGNSGDEEGERRWER